MNSRESNHRRKRLDETTSRRLAKLRTLPVDTSRLLEAVEAQIPLARLPQRHFLLTWLTPLRAVAASLFILGLIAALVITSSSGPVLASAERLAEIHGEVLTAGGDHVTRVDSMDAANTMLKAEWSGAPLIPQLSEGQITSCCIHMMGRKRTACVAFEFDGVPITMAVAEKNDVKMPSGNTLNLDGITYRIQSHEGINMVMTERGGRWVCLMGKLSVSRLAELAGKLQF